MTDFKIFTRKAVVEDQQFLLELGKGFAFVERQQRIATEDQGKI